MKLAKNIDSRNLSKPLSLEDKINIFIDRVKYWQLDIAEKVIERIPDSGFATLSIILSYFEMIAKYIDGYDKEGCSEYYFNNGVKKVISGLNYANEELDLALISNLLKTMYKGGRCGLYHAGMTDRRIILTGDIDKIFKFTNFVDLENLCLIINPHLLAKQISKHFLKFEQELKDSSNTKLRSNFEKRFDFEQEGTKLNLIDLVKLWKGEMGYNEEKKC